MKDRKFEDAGDVDLDRDDHGFTNPDGSRLTEADAARATKRVAEQAARQRAVTGRPSLTAPGVKSPTVNARVPKPMKEALQARAKAEGVGENVIVRRALEEYLHA